MPEDLPGKDLTLQPAGEHGLSLRRTPTPSIKTRVAGVVMAAAAAFGIGMKVEAPQKVGSAVGISANAVRQVGEKIGEIGESRPTAEQIAAFKLLKSAPEGLIITDVKVKQVIDNGKVIDVNVRNKPSSLFVDSNEPDSKAGKGISTVKAGTVLRGIVVEGNDSRFGSNPLARGAWLYVNDTDDPLKGGFIDGNQLEYNPNFLGTKPLKLKDNK